MEFLYIFGLMFFEIFGAVMLAYPLLSVIFRAGGRRSHRRTDGDSVKRNVRR